MHEGLQFCVDTSPPTTAYLHGKTVVIARSQGGQRLCDGAHPIEIIFSQIERFTALASPVGLLAFIAIICRGVFTTSFSPEGNGAFRDHPATRVRPATANVRIVKPPSNVKKRFGIKAAVLHHLVAHSGHGGGRFRLPGRGDVNGRGELCEGGKRKA